MDEKVEKPIICVNTDQIFMTKKECCSIMSIRPGILERCLNGKQKHYKHLYFMYLDEYYAKMDQN